MQTRTPAGVSGLAECPAQCRPRASRCARTLMQACHFNARPRVSVCCESFRTRSTTTVRKHSRQHPTDRSGLPAVRGERSPSRCVNSKRCSSMRSRCSSTAPAAARTPAPPTPAAPRRASHDCRGSASRTASASAGGRGRRRRGGGRRARARDAVIARRRPWRPARRSHRSFENSKWQTGRRGRGDQV